MYILYAGVYICRSFYCSFNSMHLKCFSHHTISLKLKVKLLVTYNYGIIPLPICRWSLLHAQAVVLPESRPDIHIIINYGTFCAFAILTHLIFKNSWGSIPLRLSILCMLSILYILRYEHYFMVQHKCYNWKVYRPASIPIYATESEID